MTALLLPQGSQTPRVDYNPPGAVSFESGVEAVEFAGSVGVHLDPWQRHVMRAFLAERADGKWAAFETGLLVARQNGKGEILMALALAGLFLHPHDKLILHSAHEFKTAAEAFLRIKAVLDGSDALRKQIKTVRTSHGEEGIELLNGKRLRFVARSKSSGRGFSVDRVILDESQELPGRAVNALFPTLAARRNPQITYTGTVPEDINDSDHWQSIRDRGRSGTDRSLCWQEWSPEGSDVGAVDLDDLQHRLDANPAAGIRITLEYIERERQSVGVSDPTGWARERLSVWPSKRPGDGIFAAGAWPAALEVEAELLGTPVFALDVAMDRRSAAIAACGPTAPGALLGEVIEQQPGTPDWCVDRLVELTRGHGGGVVVDPGSPAGSLIAALEDAHVTVWQVSARDYAQACGALIDDVAARAFVHRDDAGLDAAVVGAKTRELAGGIAWDRRTKGADICPLVAVTLARWGYREHGGLDLAGSVW